MFSELDFFIPVTESLREILLIAEAILVLLILEMGIVYTRKFFKTKGNNTILAWGALLFTYSIVYVVFLIADFYIDQDIVGVVIRSNVLHVAYIAGLIGVFLFSYNIEKEIKLKKHIISIISLALTGFIILNMFIPMISEPTYLTLAGWLVFIIIVVVYIKRFTAKMGDKWRLNVYSLIIGSFLMILGFGASADFSLNLFGGLWIRLLGDFLVIGGILLVSALFIGVPSLAEFDWGQKIKYLNVIHNSGISIGHFDFAEGSRSGIGTIDGLLMAGGLTSLSQIVSEIVKSDKKMDFVDHGDVKLLFEYGKYLINVLIVEEPLVILRSKLKKFTEQMEFIYEDNLAKWDGDLEQFKFMDALIKANFIRK